MPHRDVCLFVMSGYTGQEGLPFHEIHHTSHKMPISPDIAFELRHELETKPDGAAARFILTAADEGWTIAFPRLGTLLPGYDDIMHNMDNDLVHDNPAVRKYGELVARSVPIYLEGDGK